MRGANRFEEDALKHGRDDLIFFIREEKIVRGKRTRTSLRKRRKKRETRANKERAFKGSIRIARINIMHKYKRKTQTHTYLLSYCDTQLDARPSSLGSKRFLHVYFALSHSSSRIFPLFECTEPIRHWPSFPPPFPRCCVAHLWPKMLQSSFSHISQERYNSANSLQAPKHTRARLFVSLKTHTHTSVVK